jgi:hypothetical protein
MRDELRRRYAIDVDSLNASPAAIHDPRSWPRRGRARSDVIARRGRGGMRPVALAAMTSMSTIIHALGAVIVAALKPLPLQQLRRGIGRAGCSRSTGLQSLIEDRGDRARLAALPEDALALLEADDRARGTFPQHGIDLI